MRYQTAISNTSFNRKKRKRHQHQHEKNRRDHPGIANHCGEAGFSRQQDLSFSRLKFSNTDKRKNNTDHNEDHIHIHICHLQSLGNAHQHRR